MLRHIGALFHLVSFTREETSGPVCGDLVVELRLGWLVKSEISDAKVFSNEEQEYLA